MTAPQEQSPAAEKEEEEIVASKYRHNAYIGKTAVAGAGAALFAVLTLALRAWRTHRCNQLADARPWRDVVDSKKQ